MCGFLEGSARENESACHGTWHAARRAVGAGALTRARAVRRPRGPDPDEPSTPAVGVAFDQRTPLARVSGHDMRRCARGGGAFPVLIHILMGQ